MCYIIDFSISKTEKKGKRGKAARPSIVGNRLTEIENEIKAIEEDARQEKIRNEANDSSSEDDSEDDGRGKLGN